jgi:acyl-CoA thioester hydrolase
MMTKPAGPPPGAAITTVLHSVQFYETDAMGIVHHSNYVRFLEHVRVAFLDEHDKPYLAYVADGFHMPVTRVSLQYKRPTRFADVIEITGWLAWARHASFGFAYQLKVASELVAQGETDHALTCREGRPRRIPEPTRVRMEGWLGMLASVEARERSEGGP